MKPVDQLVMADKENGIFGDCQRAVLASLLDLPIKDVPHFAHDAKGQVWEFRESIQEFCREHGFIYVDSGTRKIHAFGDDGDIFHAISGPSPRGQGMYHCVVGKNYQIEHDPHPSRAGLAGDPKEWTYSFLVKS